MSFQYIGHHFGCLSHVYDYFKIKIHETNFSLKNPMLKEKLHVVL